MLQKNKQHKNKMYKNNILCNNYEKILKIHLTKLVYDVTINLSKMVTREISTVHKLFIFFVIRQPG